MKSIKDLFSLKRHKSNDDIFTKSNRKVFSASSLTNLANFVLSKKCKSVSLINIEDSSLGDISCESIRLYPDEQNPEERGDSKQKRSRQCDEDGNYNNNNVSKKMKYEDDMDVDKAETLNESETQTCDKEYKSVTLRLCPHENIGLEIYPKWTFSSNKIAGYYISHITPGSSAEKSKILKVGDEILKVNGDKLTELPPSLAQNYFTAKRGTLELIISREKQQNINTFSGSDPVFNCPAVTGMKKFTQPTSNVQVRRRKNPSFTERYCSITGQFYISVRFCKGPGLKPMGFSVVGGKDSPKANMGIYIKNIFEYGQAAELGVLKEGDEVISVNDKILKGLTHKEAVEVFKNVKNGYLFVEVARKSLKGQFRNSF